MENNITPGPWEIWGTPGEKPLSVGPVAGGVAVCEIVTTTGEGFFNEDSAARGAANARAIAALPDLLACLEAFCIDHTNPCGCENCAVLRRARGDIPPVRIIGCPSCNGTGHWETECCNGANGCDCRGERIDMGTCNVCGGAGTIPEDAPSARMKSAMPASRTSVPTQKTLRSSRSPWRSASFPNSHNIHCITIPLKLYFIP